MDRLTGLLLGSRGGTIAIALLSLEVVDLLVYFGPHVLKGLRSTAGHLDSRPVDSFAVFFVLGDDSQKELVLRWS